MNRVQIIFLFSLTVFSLAIFSQSSLAEIISTNPRECFIKIQKSLQTNSNMPDLKVVDEANVWIKQEEFELESKDMLLKTINFQGISYDFYISSLKNSVSDMGTVNPINAVVSYSLMSDLPTDQSEILNLFKSESQISSKNGNLINSLRISKLHRVGIQTYHNIHLDCSESFRQY